MPSDSTKPPADFDPFKALQSHLATSVMNDDIIQEDNDEVQEVPVQGNLNSESGPGEPDILDQFFAMNAENQSKYERGEMKVDMNVNPNLELEKGSTSMEGETSTSESGVLPQSVTGSSETNTKSSSSSSTPLTSSAKKSKSVQNQKSSLDTPEKRRLPTVILFVGMAGSGKTTLLHQSYLQLEKMGKRVYAMNLDPAVKDVKYPCALDIRDTVDYKNVMKQFGHGPNGAIMTSLNLFATKFDQVLSILEKRAPGLDYILVDTPGQIEVFGWSASGQIISDALSVTFPTVINYVVDTARCVRPVTFMSNMLYACSILYKMQLPFILSFNKIDVMNCKFVRDVWMKDPSAFSDALRKDESTYLGSLSRSMSRALEEFYTELNSCGVSAYTGEGVEQDLLTDCLHIAREEYFSVFLNYLEQKHKFLERKREKEANYKMRKFEKDLGVLGERGDIVKKKKSAFKANSKNTSSTITKESDIKSTKPTLLPKLDEESSESEEKKMVVE